MSKKSTLKSLLFLTLVVFTGISVYLFWSVSRVKFLTVAILNIGQGDSIYIEAPNGNQILIDGGPGKSVLRELGTLMHFYDRSIDVVIASHPDADHVGGLIDVLNNYKANIFMEPGVSADTAVYRELKANMEKSKYGKIKEILARRGQVIDLGGGVRLEILYPNMDVTNWETNDASIVARLVYGENEFLFTGDAPFKTERALMYMNPSFESIKSDVLKVGHHGSKNSTNPEFVSAVDPEYGAISVGSGNRYGHPTEQVLNILEDAKVKILRTDKDGRVVFESDGVNLSLVK
jgi:competence protein ComEC